MVCTLSRAWLALDTPQVPQFVLLCPGFKALSMSVGQRYIVKAAVAEEKWQTQPGYMYRRAERERPLKFAVAWVRIVAKLMGPASSWRTAAASKRVEVRQRAFNSLDWANELVLKEQREAEREEDEERAMRAGAALPAVARARLRAAGQVLPDDEALFEAAASAQRKAAMAKYRQRTFGDSRTLASEASKPGWRASWSAEQQVRTELLRLAGSLPGGIAGNQDVDALAKDWLAYK